MVKDLQLIGLRDRYRNAIRALRPAVLASFDAMINAHEDKHGTPLKNVRALRSELRDAPAADGIDKAKSVDDLAALWPKSLGDFPAAAFDGWDAPPEPEGVHVVVDLAPKKPTEEEEALAAKTAEAFAGIDVDKVMETRRERAKEEALRPPPPPRRQRITGRAKS